MAINKTKRLRPSVLQADIDAYAALQAIGDYRPANDGFNAANGTSAKTAMETKQTEEVQKQAAADAANDDAVAAEWAFHDYILGVKDQVKAQYGKDSNELQSLGLKKKSEYKTGRRSSPNNRNETP
ncbi:hypothetical protein BH10ACI1_BH10ACI1_12410 [soil metagenome]